MDDIFSGNAKALRKDRFIALALCFIIFLLGCINLDNNCNWGDDFAAYMADGFALADGRYEEQTKLNLILRSGRLLGEQTEHVHVFGYPLLHALVYSLAGFDTIAFSNLYLYKLPSLIALSMMAGVYYLFLRKRLGAVLSFYLTLALCADPRLHYEIRNLYNDVLFLALSTASFYVMELFLEKPRGRKRLFLAVFLGILLWYTYSVRLNGIVSAVCVLAALLFLQHKKYKDFKLSDFIPVGSFLVFFVIFNLIVFPQPSSTSSASDISFEGFINGASYYLGMLHLWARHFVEIVLKIPVKLAATVLYSLFSSPEICTLISRGENFMYTCFTDFLAIIFLLLSLLGIISHGIRQELHIVLFLFFSFIGTAALNLGQELRYLYVLLPFLLMYAAQGAIFVSKRLTKRKNGTGRSLAVLKFSAVLILCIFSIQTIFSSGISNLKNNTREDLTAYSDGAIEVYSYIQKHVDAEDTIAFFKPRALYLNTGRVSLLPEKDGFKITDADYYLYYVPSQKLLITADLEDSYRPCFENYEFILYEKLETD